VEEAVHSQFKAVSETISEGKFEGIRLSYFGIFHVNQGRKKHLDKKSDAKRQKRIEEDDFEEDADESSFD
jgi:hypothetical protein